MALVIWIDDQLQFVFLIVQDQSKFLGSVRIKIRNIFPYGSIASNLLACSAGKGFNADCNLRIVIQHVLHGANAAGCACADSAIKVPVHFCTKGNVIGPFRGGGCFRHFGCCRFGSIVQFSHNAFQPWLKRSRSSIDTIAQGS